MDCDASLFNKTAIDNCTDITLKEETIQEKNLAELEQIKNDCDYDKQCQYSEESFADATTTIKHFPDEMTEQEVENIVKSYEVISKSMQYTDQDADNALRCLFQGGDCEIDI